MQLYHPQPAFTLDTKGDGNTTSIAQGCLLLKNHPGVSSHRTEAQLCSLFKHGLGLEVR